MAEKTSANLGWHFYKNYYQHPEIDWSNLKESEKTEKAFQYQNSLLFSAEWNKDSDSYYIKGKQQLHFKTTYPGLLLGTGYNHETGAKGEIKIGFYFDHTTGLPTIPGSSLKGVIRSAFDSEKKEGNLIFNHKDYLNHIFQNKMNLSTLPDLNELMEELFEGRNKNNMYEHDIFYDAFISGTDDGKILDADYITPHSNPLKNPVPLQFLKIRPGVSITFNFDLNDGVISADRKKDLIKHIIADLGMGAKTNVGYGYLSITSR